MRRTTVALIAFTASSSLLLAQQQERPVPKDSTRLSIAGCAHGRVFTVGRDPDSESHAVELEEGMKLRLEGAKKVLNDIKAREGSMVEISGLMKKSEVIQPGIGMAGGKVRITPVNPIGRNTYDPGPQIPVIDVESYRLLNSSCPKR